MCTIAILVNACEAPLVVAANRDEMYARASRGPTRLAPGVAGGVDAVGGGTWLAVRRDGGFAAITNQAGAVAPPDARSRGLVVRELALSADPDDYVARLDPRGYASMNLMWGNARGVRVGYLRTTGERDVVRLPDGIHVLCNDRIECASPRGARVGDALARAVREARSLDHVLAAFPALLADHARAADSSPLDAPCIHTPVYGTRCSTIAAFAAPGDGDRVLAYLHADGPPCTTPFIDRRELLDD